MMSRLQYFIDLVATSPSFAEFETVVTAQVANQVYRAPNLADAIRLRKDAGSLATYDSRAQAEWFGQGTAYALPVTDPVRVYRATKDWQAIHPGDYVTPSRSYARLHQAANLASEGTIKSLIVTLDDLFPADGPNEFWYAPRELDAYKSLYDFYVRNACRCD